MIALLPGHWQGLMLKQLHVLTRIPTLSLGISNDLRVPGSPCLCPETLTLLSRIGCGSLCVPLTLFAHRYSSSEGGQVDPEPGPPASPRPGQ